MKVSRSSQESAEVQSSRREQEGSGRPSKFGRFWGCGSSRRRRVLGSPKARTTRWLMASAVWAVGDLLRAIKARQSCPVLHILAHSVLASAFAGGAIRPIAQEAFPRPVWNSSSHCRLDSPRPHPLLPCFLFLYSTWAFTWCCIIYVVVYFFCLSPPVE